MKYVIVVVGFLLLGTLSSLKCFAQADELAELALDIEKLAQFKQILSDLKKGYEILFSGYNTIKNISKGDFEIHKTFLDGLLAVSPAVRNYKRVADVIDYQVRILKEYKTAYGRFRRSGQFGENELAYMERVYDNLFAGSVKNIEDLISITTVSKLRMSDDERLAGIDNIFNDMSEKLGFLISFNNSNSLLALQRAKEQVELKSVRRYFHADK